MRILAVADVHANLSAFEAVIEQERAAGGIDVIWSLGDLVGYGPDPSECIALLRSYAHEAICGNHDLAAIGALGLEDFNPIAAEAAVWTAQTLSSEEREWLGSLPQVIVEPAGTGFTLVHGSLADPVWEYLVSPWEAEEHLTRQTTPYCLVGHSHLPLIFLEVEGGVSGAALGEGERIALGRMRFIANPGGLGQPRDGDAHAPYALVDTEAKSITFRRAAYDIARTQQRMQTAGLPDHLIERLSRGR